MAVIGSIRKRGTLIVAVVGLSLLAFVLTGSQSFFSGTNDKIASINGTKISYNQYQQKINDKVNLYNTVRPGADLDENTMDQLKEESWNDLIRTMVYQKQYDKLGIRLTDAEINDLFVGETADLSIKQNQQFMDPNTGMFDPNRVQQYSQQFEDETKVPEDQLQVWLSYKAQWFYMQDVIKQGRLESKYINLVSKGMYTTSKEAQSQYKANSDRANIRFVMKPYALIADSTVKFTEDELVNFFKEYKYRMRQKKSKSIKYAVFLSTPTTQDSIALRDGIMKLRDELATTDNDTVFVAQNSDESTPPMFVKKGNLTPVLDSLLFNAPKGTVAGPFVENGYYVIAKKLEERFLPDSAKARHILIEPKENSEAGVKNAEILRDSIYTALKNGADFAVLAAKYSADASAKDTGNLGWFVKDKMVKEFNDTVFNGKKGELKKVNTQFGFHVVYIQDFTAPVNESQIAIVVKSIQPSDDTRNVQYAKASDLISGKGNGKDFDGVKYMEDFSKKNNLIFRDEPMVTEASKNILGMENTKQIVKWALGAKRGEMSDVFESGNNYIVAIVSANHPEGIPSLDDVRDEAILALRKHKKAEQFIGEFNSAMGTSKDINGIAAAMKLQAMNANDVSFGSFFIPGAGIEPELLGTVYGVKVGQLTKPIEGNSGVFVAVVDQFNPAPALPDYKFMQNEAMRNNGNKAREVFNTLKEKANIKDYRYKFDNF